jgi:hypothetical protein
VPLNLTPAISLHVGQQRILDAAIAPTGTVVACIGNGVRVELKVPPVPAHGAQGYSAIGFKKNHRPAVIHITRRSKNHTVVVCDDH